MKKNTLNTSADFEGLVFGISASVKDYRLCHFINKKLGINLQKPESLVGESDDPQEKLLKDQPFIYTDVNGEWGFNFYLIPNKKKGGYWYPKYKNVNFILILPDASATSMKEWLKAELQSIDIIQAVFRMEGRHSQTLKALNLD